MSAQFLGKISTIQPAKKIVILSHLYRSNPQRWLSSAKRVSRLITALLMCVLSTTVFSEVSGNKVVNANGSAVQQKTIDATSAKTSVVPKSVNLSTLREMEAELPKSLLSTVNGQFETLKTELTPAQVTQIANLLAEAENMLKQTQARYNQLKTDKKGDKNALISYDDFELAKKARAAVKVIEKKLAEIQGGDLPLLSITMTAQAVKELSLEDKFSKAQNHFESLKPKAQFSGKIASQEYLDAEKAVLKALSDMKNVKTIMTTLPQSSDGDSSYFITVDQETTITAAQASIQAINAAVDKLDNFLKNTPDDLSEQGIKHYVEEIYCCIGNSRYFSSNTYINFRQTR
jgi:hypothetical protein